MFNHELVGLRDNKGHKEIVTSICVQLGSVDAKEWTRSQSV